MSIATARARRMAIIVFARMSSSRLPGKVLMDFGGRPLLAHFIRQPRLSDDELDVFAHKLMENQRIASRVTPMLGLVATMIPMGPALKSLSDGNLADVSHNLTIAFSAVILALIAASITYWAVNVRRRWLAEELLEIQALRGANA